MARAHFGDAPVRSAGEDARGEVFRGARLRITVDLPGLRCNPDEAELDWWEPVHQVVFRLLAGPDLVGSVVRGAVRVWCGPLLLGEVSLAIGVTASASGPPSPSVAESAPAVPQDFPVLLPRRPGDRGGFAEVVRALGDEYLQDVLALRSGERWRTRLPELIEEADVFQLFWSSNSMRSPYCQQEWEHALALGRPLFVRPLYWEDPMPQDPTMGLPPVALRELHFIKYNVHAGPGGHVGRPGRGIPWPSPARERSASGSAGRSASAPQAGAIPARCGPASGAGGNGASWRVWPVPGRPSLSWPSPRRSLLGPKSTQGAIESPTRSSAVSADADSARSVPAPESGEPPGYSPPLLLPADITDPASQCSPYEPPYAWADARPGPGPGM